MGIKHRPVMSSSQGNAAAASFIHLLLKDWWSKFSQGFLGTVVVPYLITVLVHQFVALTKLQSLPHHYFFPFYMSISMP